MMASVDRVCGICCQHVSESGLCKDCNTVTGLSGNLFSAGGRPITASGNRRCDDCSSIAGFGYPGKTHTKCFKHQLPNMINVVAKRCVVELCPKLAKYGPRYGKPTLCGEHKLEGMVPDHGMLCQQCDKIGMFKHVDTGDRYCANHRDKAKTITICNRVCVDCDKEASFGLRKGEKPTHCGEHATPGMFNVRAKVCTEEGCTRQPIFGPVGGKPIRCSDHTLPDDRNLVDAQCDHASHDKDAYASFGFVGERMSKCGVHRLPGMVFKPTRTCCEDGCTELGSEVKPDERGPKDPRYCLKHAPPGTITLFTAACSLCGLPDVLNADKLCSDCNPEATKIRKLKEDAVAAKLEAAGIKVTSRDKQAYGMTRTLRARPDFVIDCGTHLVIVECDEHGHRPYKCEVSRMINVTEEFRRPASWIRFNPDNIKGSDGRVIKVSLAERYSTLIKWVKESMKRNPADHGAIADVVYLYYGDEAESERKTLIAKHADSEFLT